MSHFSAVVLIVLLALAAAPFNALAAAPAPADFYVAPNGNDAWSGKRPAPAAGNSDGPFATLERARQAVRQWKAAQPAPGKPITVLIRGGVYYLPGTLAFTPEDSGASEAAPVVYAAYPGETPLLSGGRPLAGAWTPRGNGIFSTSAAGPGVFRQLYVNGKRATVARTPNADAPIPWKRLKQWDPTTQSVRLDGPDNLSKNLQRQNQIEMVVKHHWAVARLHLGPWGTFDNDNVIFPPEKQVFKSPAPKENGQWYYLENALEYLDQPGEWYLDRTTNPAAAPIVYYKPRPGENLAKATVIAPRVDKLMTITGTPETPVRHLVFRGLRFEHANWVHKNNNGSEGYVGAQGHLFWDDWSTAPAAVELTYTRDVNFTGNRFENLGGAGVKLVKGTRNTRIEGNRFAEIGDCGILVYTGGNIHAETEDADQCCDDVIRSNYIENTGRETLQGTGITVVDAQRIRVEHNEITGTPAAGISFGYFNTDKALSAGNIVRANYIHDVVTQVDDQAGIYVYGTRFDLPPNPPGNTLLVTGNLIENVVRGPYQDGNPIAAMYLDEGARGAVFRDNVFRNNANTIHVNTWSTDPKLSVRAPNTDADPAIEAQAGIVDRQWMPAVAPSRKKAPVFPATPLLARYPKNGGAPLSLDGKTQYASLPAARLGERFTACVWAKLEQTDGVQTLFGNAADGKQQASPHRQLPTRHGVRRLRFVYARRRIVHPPLSEIRVDGVGDEQSQEG